MKKTDSRVSISSTARLRIRDIKTGAIIYDGNGKDFYFHPEEITSPVIIESWENPIVVDNEAYRGIIELHNVLGRIYVINILRINEYLYSVVAGEIISTWNMQALKAQAIAARTYTYRHLLDKKKSLYDLDCTSNFQVYKGISIEKKNTNKAVDETSGMIAVYNNKPIISFFHSTCGGLTADDSNVWNGEDNAYLKPVVCKFCKESPYYEWEEEIKLYEIRECLNNIYKGTGNITGISFCRENNRIVSAIIRHTNGIIKLTGNEFRLIFPEKKLKSLYFSAEKTRDGLILKGHGWGHGVGLCQWGAKGMAENGASYKDILRYYYKGIRIVDTGKGVYAGK